MFARLSLRAKLLGGFLSAAAIALALGGVGYYAVTSGGEAIDELGVVRLPSVDSLLVISEAQTAVDSAENALLSTQLDAKTREAQHQRFADAKKRAADAWKVYEPLPQTAEEAETWKQFVPAWEKWWKDHEDYVKIVREFDAFGIADPTVLQRDLQQFMKDHYKLRMTIVNHVQNGEECKGGDDATACNYGKWMAQFASSNAELKRVVDATKPSHDAFHAAVKKAKESAARGDKEGGLKFIHGELEQACEKTFEGFDALLAEANKAGGSLDKATHQALVTNGESFAAAETLLNKIVQINRDVATAEVKDSQGQATMFKTVSLAMAIVAVVVTVALGLGTTQSIARSLRNTFKGLKSCSSQELEETAQTFNRILDSMNESVEQVNTAVSQMDKVTQQNAAGAEESASAAEELSAQAATTSGLVDELLALVRGTEARVVGSMTSASRMKTNFQKPAAGHAAQRKPVKTLKRASSYAASSPEPAFAGSGGDPMPELAAAPGDAKLADF